MPQLHLPTIIIIHNVNHLILTLLRQAAAALIPTKILFAGPVHEHLPSTCGSLLHQHLLLLLGKVLTGSMAQGVDDSLIPSWIDYFLDKQTVVYVEVVLLVDMRQHFGVSVVGNRQARGPFFVGFAESRNILHFRMFKLSNR